MAYFSLHAYDADVWVREFRGLNQSSDTSLNTDPMYATEEWNLETLHGVLQPQAAMRELDGEFEDRVETLAVLHRRWYEGSGSNEWYVACAGGKFYQKQKNAGTWMQIEMPSGVTAFQSSAWSWVTYEVLDETDQDNPKKIDVLLLSNALDGMIMIIPPDRPRTWNDIKSMTWNTVKGMTWGELMSPAWQIDNTIDTQGYKFGVIERYAERIWGTAIADAPDTLVYSRPYKPDDWTVAGSGEEPEDGAGMMDQPTWDGDRFYALLAFGDQLLAFKRNRVFRIMGTNPGEFSISEQYGAGTSYYQTIAKDGERVYMATREGMSIFDGMTATPWWRDQVEQIWRTVNLSALDQMCGVMFHRRYYLSFPTGNSTVNNTVLVYNLDEGTVLLYKGMQIEAFLPTNDALFATSSSLPGKILEIRYDSWTDGAAEGKATRWVSPWLDFGYKRIAKGGFDVYFVPEVQSTAVTLTFSIQTEKKTKTKNYIVLPKKSPKEHKGKRLHFSGTGRRFRIIIETASGVTAPWRLIGGLQLVVETDPD